MLKVLSAWGAECFYTGFFSLGQPFPPVRNWIWQAATPAYAQAVTSLYSDVLFSGRMLALEVGAGGRAAVVRKHSTMPVYVIALAAERNSNIKGNCKDASNVTVCVTGTNATAAWNITLETRLQGSVYMIDRSSSDSDLGAPKVVQLDGWHGSRHPSDWPQEVVIESELIDLMHQHDGGRGRSTAAETMLERAQTERPSDAAVVTPDLGDFSAFTSFVSLSSADPSLAIELKFRAMAQCTCGCGHDRRSAGHHHPSFRLKIQMTTRALPAPRASALEPRTGSGSEGHCLVLDRIQMVRR